jgi:nucleotide-binding universal stress UspA family protein
MESAGANARGTILCALDHSDVSHAAARVAARLSEELGLRLVFVAVAAPVTAPGVSAAPYGQERLAEQERADAEELLAQVADEVGASGVERRVEFGSAASCILETAEQEEASYLVLGTRGRSGVRAALLGSVSREVASHARCPVVLVPSE